MKRNTYDSRAAIGFPQDPREWRDLPATFTKERLVISGHPVMEEWERDYMKLLASIAASRPRRILEIGFGMGIAAGFIQEFEPEEHIVIEANREVYERLLEFAADARGKVTPVFGFWEEETARLSDASVSGILFDTYPLKRDEIHRNHFTFFREAYRLLEEGGILTYYSDEERAYSRLHRQTLEEAGFRDVQGEVCRVSPPTDCAYWQKSTILAPIVFKGRS